MKPVRVLYLGRNGGTSLDRALAYERLGHTVRHIDLRNLLHPSPWVDRVVWRLGAGWFTNAVVAGLAAELGNERFDICHVDGGEWVTPGVITALRRHCASVVNYNHDDPFGDRDARFFKAYRQSVPHYDLLVVVREENVDEARRAGVRKVLRVFRSADEVTHRPRSMNAEDAAAWASEVLFVGTWMPERGPFMLELLRRGVPLAIRGSGWDKAPEWRQLQPAWRGPAVYGDDYARAIQGAKVSLGLLSKGNRDLHTTRSSEVPTLGGLFCAERTVEHLSMYDDGVEAVFWNDAAECANHCLALLADEPRRVRIAQQGQLRARRNGYLNEAVIRRILEVAGAAPAAVAPQAPPLPCLAA